MSAMAFASTKETLVVECVPDGGVLAARWGLPHGFTTIADLAANGSELDLWDCAQPWMHMARLLPGDPSPMPIQHLVAAQHIADRIATAKVPILVDLGRLRADAATESFLGMMDRLWLLLEPAAEHVAIATKWRQILRHTTVRVLIVDRPLSSGRYPAHEIEDLLGWLCIDTIRRDRQAALALRGVGAPIPFLLERTPLVRQAGALRDRIELHRSHY